MAYSPRMRFTKVTDDNFARRIIGHYNLNPDDVGVLFCAMSNNPHDPQTPREVLVATNDMIDQHEIAWLSDKHALMRYLWPVSEGRLRLSATPELWTPEQASQALAQIYGPERLLEGARIGQAAADLLRLMRENGQTGHALHKSIDENSGRRYVSIHSRSRQSWKIDEDTPLWDRFWALDKALSDRSRAGGTAGAIDGLAITGDGIIGVQSGDHRDIIAVDPDQYPAPAIVQAEAPAPSF